MSSSHRAQPFVPVLLVLIPMLSVQVGASLAKQIFPLVGAEGAAALRQLFAALILVAVFRPWRRLPATRRDWGVLWVYGLVLGLMNITFYLAIARIPLGIAVALEFTGPLAIALFASRRPLDLVWVAAAVLGLLGLLPLEATGHQLDPLGIALALAAGVFWGAYIIAGQKSGARIHSLTAVSLGMAISTLTTMPVALFNLATGEIAVSGVVSALPFAVGIALLSSAIPYSFEMVALKRLSAKVFSILMSLEPAVAALAGLVLLREQLSLIQWIAILLIVVASAGAAFGSRPSPPPDRDPPGKASWRTAA